MHINQKVSTLQLINAYKKNMKNFMNNNILKQTNNSIVSKNFSKINLKNAKPLHTELKELKFEKNILDIKRNTCYKVKTLFHGYSNITVTSLGVERLSAIMYPNIDYTEYISNDELEDAGRVFDLINVLNRDLPHDKKIDLIRIIFPQVSECKAILQSMNAEINNFISLDGGKNQVYFDENGWLYTKEELSNLRRGYLTSNFFKFGYTKDSKIIIDGKEYKLDDTGHIPYIPEDAICTPSHVELIK